MDCGSTGLNRNVSVRAQRSARIGSEAAHSAKCATGRHHAAAGRGERPAHVSSGGFSDCGLASQESSRHGTACSCSKQCGARCCAWLFASATQHCVVKRETSSSNCSLSQRSKVPRNEKRPRFGRLWFCVVSSSRQQWRESLPRRCFLHRRCAVRPPLREWRPRRALPPTSCSKSSRLSLLPRLQSGLFLLLERSLWSRCSAIVFLLCSCDSLESVCSSCSPCARRRRAAGTSSCSSSTSSLESEKQQKAVPLFSLLCRLKSRKLVSQRWQKKLLMRIPRRQDTIQRRFFLASHPCFHPRSDVVERLSIRSCAARTTIGL